MAEPRIYRASSLGYSLEQLVCPHLGYEAIPPPEWLQAAFDEGNEIEPRCLDRLCLQFTDGEFIDNAQKEVELEVIPGIAKVVGHLDGIIHYQDQPGRVLEIKSMNGKTWEQVRKHGFNAGGIMDKYAWQISAYQLATGLNALMVFWNKADEKLHTLEVDGPLYTVSDIANRLQRAEDHINAGTIPEGCKDYPCPYFFLHPPIEEPEPAGEELDGLLDAWREANRKKKVYEAEEAALREMVKEYVGEIAGKVKGSQGITVSTNWVPGKEVSYTKAGHWETRINPPRERKGDSAN